MGRPFGGVAAAVETFVVWAVEVGSVRLAGMVASEVAGGGNSNNFLGGTVATSAVGGSVSARRLRWLRRRWAAGSEVNGDGGDGGFGGGGGGGVGQFGGTGGDGVRAGHADDVGRVGGGSGCGWSHLRPCGWNVYLYESVVPGHDLRHGRTGTTPSSAPLSARGSVLGGTTTITDDRHRDDHASAALTSSAVAAPTPGTRPRPGGLLIKNGTGTLGS